MRLFQWPVLMRTISPIHEEDEEEEETELDPNPLLMQPPFLDAMSVSTYHTTTHDTTEEPVKVRRGGAMETSD